MATKDQQITDMLRTTVEALGFELWGIEYLSQGRHSVLRVYIEAENGIAVEDCATVSEQVGSVLDVEDPITGEYTLEVSSPGMDRLLFKLDQYPGLCRRRYWNCACASRLRGGASSKVF